MFVCQPKPAPRSSAAVGRTAFIFSSRLWALKAIGSATTKPVLTPQRIAAAVRLHGPRSGNQQNRDRLSHRSLRHEWRTCPASL
jgi:hypothetical protein